MVEIENDGDGTVKNGDADLSSISSHSKYRNPKVLTMLSVPMRTVGGVMFAATISETKLAVMPMIATIETA